MGRGPMFKTLLFVTPVLILIGLLVIRFIITQPSFMEADNFIGDYFPDQRWPTFFAGESSYDGTIVFTGLQRDIVEDVLPDDLVLGENNISSDFHPILLITGVQTSGFAGLPTIPIKFSYDEQILIIPFVRHVNGEFWHNYVVRMYLNSDVAVMGGILIWGYPKEKAEFDTASELKIYEGGVELFSSQITRSNGWRSHSEARLEFENFKEMEEILRMPIMGEGIFSWDFTCSYFEWTFPYGEIQEIDMDYEFVNSFAPGMGAWLGEHTNIVEGAWRVENMRWKLEYYPMEYKL